MISGFQSQSGQPYSHFANVYVLHAPRDSPLVSRVTPADLLAASMVAKLISSIYLWAGIGGAADEHSTDWADSALVVIGFLDNRQIHKLHEKNVPLPGHLMHWSLNRLWIDDDVDLNSSYKVLNLNQMILLTTTSGQYFTSLKSVEGHFIWETVNGFSKMSLTWPLWKTNTKALPAAVSPHVNKVPKSAWTTGWWSVNIVSFWGR